MRPLARWNPERDLWETDQGDLLSGLSDVYSETWPRSGMTRGGTAYALPTSEHRTDASECSLLLPTPAAYDGERGGPQSPEKRRAGGHQPTVNDMGEGKTVEAWDEWTAKMQAAHGNGNGHGKSLAIEAQRLLPTPTVEDRKASGSAGYGGNEFCTLTDATVRQPDRWGIYADAIARWEAITRPAPAPTQPSKKGTPQLSPAFSEWLMGLPDGHVTEVPGLSRNDMLKALGNGVVPQQAAHALRLWLTSALAVAA